MQRAAREALCSRLAVTLGCAALSLPSAASAQPAPSDRTQFLLIVDDSASMGAAPPHTDTDRLALLAARAFVAVLGPDDRAAVVGMNELASTTDPATINARAPAEALTDARLDANGATLAAYAGTSTPCRGALDHARAVLDRWHARDASMRQVLLFLTDGQCTGAAPQPAAEWLRGLDARFYLLRFNGNDVTPGLLDYATSSHGRELPIAAGDRLRGIVNAFATVFADAQGYSPLQLSQGAGERSFARAERLRVLALRRRGDANAPLEVRVTPVGGPVPTVDPGAEVWFQRTVNPGLGAYDYRVATVIPNGTRLRVEAGGADVALLIPDYRGLSAALRVSPAGCPTTPDARLDDRADTDLVPVGSTACVQSFLESSRGPLDPADDLAFEGRFQRGAGSDSPWRSVEAMVRRANGFTASLPADAGLNALLRASIEVAPPTGSGEASRTLVSPAHPLRADVLAWRVSALDGDATTSRVAPRAEFAPGGSVPFGLRFEGRFPQRTAARVSLKGALSEGGCVTLRGASLEDGVVRVDPGQQRSFELRAWACREGSRLSRWRCAWAARACREGAPREGSLRVEGPPGVTLEPTEIPVAVRLEAVSWWAYWGEWLLTALGALVALWAGLATLWGWIAPVKRWPDGVLRLKVQGAKAGDPKPRVDTVVLHEKMAWGWYRNAWLDADDSGNSKLKGFAIELAPGLNPAEPSVLLRPTRARAGAAHDLTVTRVEGDAEPAPTGEGARVAFTESVTLEPKLPAPFRPVARLFGRLPRVAVAALRVGHWFRIDGGGGSVYVRVVVEGTRKGRRARAPAAVAPRKERSR